jgi:hypothetical protein
MARVIAPTALAALGLSGARSANRSTPEAPHLVILLLCVTTLWALHPRPRARPCRPIRQRKLAPILSLFTADAEHHGLRLCLQIPATATAATPQAPLSPKVSCTRCSQWSIVTKDYFTGYLRHFPLG